MFDHLRRQAADRVVIAQAAVQSATADVAEAGVAVNQAAVLVDAARAALLEAKNAVPAAQADVAAAQAALDAARQRVADAQGDLTAWEDSEPPEEINGRPNPAHGAWLKRGTAIQQRVVHAQADVQPAQAARTAAGARLDAANGRVVAVTQQVDAADADLAQQQLRQQEAEQENERRRLGVQAAQADESALDAEENAILTEPADSGELIRLIDRQTAAIETARDARRDAWAARTGALADRAAALAEQDAAVDELDLLRADIRGRAWFGGLPQLTTVALGLDQVVAASAAQRSRPAGERTDDLGGTAATLDAIAASAGQALASAQAALKQASARQATANSDLQALREEWT